MNCGEGAAISLKTIQLPGCVCLLRKIIEPQQLPYLFEVSRPCTKNAGKSGPGNSLHVFVSERGGGGGTGAQRHASPPEIAAATEDADQRPAATIKRRPRTISSRREQRAAPGLTPNALCVAAAAAAAAAVSPCMPAKGRTTGKRACWELCTVVVRRRNNGVSLILGCTFNPALPSIPFPSCGRT